MTSNPQALLASVRHSLELGLLSDAATQLANPSFVSRGLKCGRIEALLENYEALLEHPKFSTLPLQSQELVSALRTALLSSRSALSEEPAQLASQLFALLDRKFDSFLSTVRTRRKDPWLRALRRLPNEIYTVGNHGKPVRDVLFLPDGTTAVSAGEDGSVRVWNTLTRSTLLRIPGDPEGVYCLAFSAPSTLLCGGESGTIRAFDVLRTEDRDTPTYELKASNSSPATRLSLTPTGQLVSAHDDGNLRMWDLEQRRENCRPVPPGSFGREDEPWFDRAGPLLHSRHLTTAKGLAACCFDNQLLCVWSTENGKLLRRLDLKTIDSDIHASAVHFLRYPFLAVATTTRTPIDASHPNATVSRDGHILALNIETQEVDAHHTTHAVTCMTYCSLSETFLSGHVDGSVSVAISEHSKPLARATHKGTTTCVSSNGVLMASGGLDGRIRLQPLAQGTSQPLRAVQSLRRTRRDTVVAVSSGMGVKSFSLDGNTLAFHPDQELQLRNSLVSSCGTFVVGCTRDPAPALRRTVASGDIDGFARHSAFSCALSADDEFFLTSSPNPSGEEFQRDGAPHPTPWSVQVSANNLRKNAPLHWLRDSRPESPALSTHPFFIGGTPTVLYTAHGHLLRMWNRLAFARRGPARLEPTRRIDSRLESIYSFALSEKNSLAFFGDTRGNLSVVHTKSGRSLHVISLPAKIDQIHMSADEELLALLLDGSRVALLESRQTRTMSFIIPPNYRINGIDTSPNNKRLLLCQDGGDVSVWNTRTATLEARYRHITSATQCQFVTDERVAFGDDEGHVVFMELSNADCWTS